MFWVCYDVFSGRLGLIGGLIRMSVRISLFWGIILGLDVVIRRCSYVFGFLIGWFVWRDFGEQQMIGDSNLFMLSFRRMCGDLDYF
jgi:hypothetical protein